MYKRSNYEGKSFAEVARRINKKYNNRVDGISKISRDLEFENLATLNDAVRSIEMPEADGQMFRGGGPHDPPGWNGSSLDAHTQQQMFPLPEGWSQQDMGRPSWMPSQAMEENEWANFKQMTPNQSRLGRDIKPVSPVTSHFRANPFTSTATPVSTSFNPNINPTAYDMPTAIKGNGPTSTNGLFDTSNSGEQQFTTGDKINFATGAMQGLYNTIRGSEEIPAPRTNPGFAKARQAYNQMGISTQAEQNDRIRNRNAYMQGVNQNSPNSSIRNANLQSIFAQDDLNTQRISQKQREMRNKVQGMLGDLSMKEGQDWQRAMEYRDRIIASQNQIKDTGIQQMFSTLGKIGDQKNYYKSILDAKKVMRDFPANFHYGEGRFNNDIKFE